MADNGLWFKLWCASLDDADLDNLDIADFGRWAKLGTYIKQHGQAGKVQISAPARTLCAMLQVADFCAFHAAVSRLPNVQINVHERSAEMKQVGETILTVSFSNWAKYQGDFSTARVRKFREMKRSRGEEKRGDEKRGDEKRGDENISYGAGAPQNQNGTAASESHPTHNGETEWPENLLHVKTELDALHMDVECPLFYDIPYWLKIHAWV